MHVPDIIILSRSAKPLPIRELEGQWDVLSHSADVSSESADVGTMLPRVKEGKWEVREASQIPFNQVSLG